MMSGIENFPILRGVGYTLTLSVLNGYCQEVPVLLNSSIDHNCVADVGCKRYCLALVRVFLRCND